MRLKYCFSIVLLGCLLGASAASVAQAPQLTPELQQMLNLMPSAQRDELLRQYSQMRPAQPVQAPQPTTPGKPQSDTPSEDAELTEAEAKALRETIVPGDTLVVDIRFPEGESGSHLLAGRRVVTLDRLGHLTLPGLSEIPLAGLNAEQAGLRLMAEPVLNGMVVKVTRLTLTATGRDALQPFGYNIFRETQSGFYPTMGAPVPGDYVVGPGDRVRVAIFGREFAEYTLAITNDGQLMIPSIGPIAVAGMRFSEMKAAVEAQVAAQTIGNRASVSMDSLRAIEVVVIGDVARPGAYTIDSLDTVLDALYAASGITEIGSLRDIRVLRDGETASRFDLYELLLKGNPSEGSLRLQDGDIVFVPSVGARAGVMGETLRPAWYELTGRTTAGQLLDFAGGASAEGDLKHAQLRRIGDDGTPRVVDVDLTTDAGRAVPVGQGDLLVLNRVVAAVGNSVALRGHFNNPGQRQWRDGLRISDFIPSLGVLRQDPDLDYGLVVRQLDNGRGVRVEMFSPRAVLEDPASSDNLALQVRDEILIFGFDDPTGRRALINPLIDRLERQAGTERGARVARVAGAVRAPGAYPLAEGMRLADLVRAGGGVGEAAYLNTAEVTRYELVNGHQRRTAHHTVNIGAAMQGNDTENLAVESHDVLTIKQLSQWTGRGSIELRGEVRFPGTYPISPGEQLSDILERAGGLTELAYPQAAVFTRASLRRKEEEQIEQMIRQLEGDAAAASGQNDPQSVQARSVSTSLAEQLRATEPVGRLVIDLPDLIANPGDVDADVLVHDGDALIVPSRPQEVTVLGEVYFPTSHIYDDELGFKGYVERSGGMTYRADDKRVYVVRANGSVETMGGRWGRNNRIYPGDTIVVPLDADRLPPLVRLTSISQIVYQLGVAAAAWNTIGVF